MRNPASSAGSGPAFLRAEASAESWSDVGTRDLLVASGIVTRAAFPKGRVRSARGIDDQGNFWILFLESRGLWCLHVERSASEVAAYREAQKSKLNAESRQRFLYAGAEEWRTLLDSNLKSTLAAVRTLMKGEGGQGTHAFRCSQREIDAFDTLAHRLGMLTGNAHLKAAEALEAAEVEQTYAASRPCAVRPILRLV